MSLTTYNFDTLKPYSLEIYVGSKDGPRLWKTDSGLPFTPMGRGDYLVLPEAPDADFDTRWRIDEIEHVIWSLKDEEVRYVTRLFVNQDATD